MYLFVTPSFQTGFTPSYKHTFTRYYSGLAWQVLPRCLMVCLGCGVCCIELTPLAHLNSYSVLVNVECVFVDVCVSSAPWGEDGSCPVVIRFPKCMCSRIIPCKVNFLAAS